MRSIKRAALVATLGVVASLPVAVPASAAPSGPMICDPGSIALKWDFVSKKWVVTHAAMVEKKYPGGSVTKKISTKKVNTVRSQVEKHGGGGIEANFAILKLGGEAKVQLQKNKKVTNQRSESVKYKLTRQGTYVFYSGTKKVSGYYTAYRCDAGTKWVKTGQYGKAQSWTVPVEGGVHCKTKVSKNSLAHKAKKFCR
ncbi:hypothetical protein PV416_38735 [Streptomyces ipomoeae]|uniref:Tat pathway signal sequence domain protein n=1 Tax=Streptomyces ipomoeae 91-03 TaxID=698759 RepID=L1L0U1_9ACTN|nr:hypothetical protein [Streptomyces ipomoeae]EKX66290.1 hypothetical protein STRIP9103_03341 [Streptomyces ipomoeae 91-03]MDX2699429.1 hypothetical protein [Streptomyces ipomoeae]MDX2826848.1 hypothetical protein [Streptomyces ipomoeae]MDX2842252.1 hypothetical protein [Streptomyces ipomoeae]MDX2879502.1 hypothetical protein [Streptomyces ipomoeae]